MMQDDDIISEIVANFRNISNEFANNSDSVPDPFRLPVYTTCEKIIISFVMGLFSFLSTFGNIMVFIAYFKVRSLRHATNYFILSLATVDLIVAIFVVNPHTMYMLIGWPYDVLPYAVCLAWLSVDYWLFQVSVFGVMLLTCDRYFSIKYPIRYRIRRTDKAVKIVLAINWIVSFLIWVPLILSYGLHYKNTENKMIEYKLCDVGSDKVVPATVIGCLVSYFLPVLIICYIVFDSTRVLIKCRHYIKPPTRRRKLGITPAIIEVSSGIDAKINEGYVTDEKSTISDNISSADYTVGLATINEERKSSLKILSVTLPTSQPNDVIVKKETTHSIKRTSFDANIKENTYCNNNDDDPSYFIEKTSFEKNTSFRKASLDRNTSFRKESFDGNKSLKKPSFERNRSLKKISFDANTSLKKTLTEGDNVVRKRRLSRLSFVQDFDKNQWMAAFNVMLGVSFVINVLPFGVLAIYRSGCDGSCISQQLWYFGYIMAYLNSMLNPLCYALGNNNFKKAFKEIIFSKN